MNNRRRWILAIITGFGFLSFVGFSVLPLLLAPAHPSSISPSPAASVAPSPAPTQPVNLAAEAQAWEDVLRRDPHNVIALENLIQTRLQLLTQMAPGPESLKVERSLIPPLQELAQLQPQEPAYQVLLAQTQERVGERDQAAETYQAILKAQPDNLQALAGFAELLLHQQRPEAAIAMLQKAIKQGEAANQAQANSVNVNMIRVYLGQVYAADHQDQAAINTFDEAIKAQPEDFRPLFMKAQVLALEHKTDEARALYAAALALAPAQYKDQIQAALAALMPPGNAHPSPTPSPS